MSLKPLFDYYKNEHTPEGAEERQAIDAFMLVLKHVGVRSGIDLDTLVQLCENTDPKIRSKASTTLARLRQQAAEAVANNLALKEQVMREKGLSNASTQVQVFDFRGADLEALRKLAAGVPPAPPVIEAKVVEVSRERPSEA